MNFIYTIYSTIYLNFTIKVIKIILISGLLNSLETVSITLIKISILYF